MTPSSEGPGRPTLLVAGTAAAIAAAPAAILAALAASDAIEPAIAGWIALGLAVAGVFVGLIWYRDLVRLSRALERAEAGRPPDDLPRLPPLRRVAEAADRLASSIRARAQEVDTLSRAAVRIVEGLPDPLIVLDREGRPVTLNTAAREGFTPPSLARGR